MLREARRRTAIYLGVMPVGLRGFPPSFIRETDICPGVCTFPT